MQSRQLIQCSTLLSVATYQAGTGKKRTHLHPFTACFAAGRYVPESFFVSLEIGVRASVNFRGSRNFFPEI